LSRLQVGDPVKITTLLFVWAIAAACIPVDSRTAPTGTAAVPAEAQPTETVAAATLAPEPTPSAQAQASATPLAGESGMPLQLTSPAFTQGGPIPLRFSCDGEDLSPALQWTEPPPGTGSFALVMDDPDAPRGTWVHWVLFNLPAQTRGLPEGLADPPEGSRHGRNSWGRSGYGGPCPPGGTHRYFFKLYALDRSLDLPPQATTADLAAAMQGHILAQAELMGTYSR
jgi:Raf kinase inhibitor-like YbhB/YbcL family protein